MSLIESAERALADIGSRIVELRAERTTKLEAEDGDYVAEASKIGHEIKTGKTETKIDLLAVRRVQSRIDRELKKIAAATDFAG